MMTSNLSKALRGFMQEAKESHDYDFYIYADSNGTWSVEISHKQTLRDCTTATGTVLATVIVHCLGVFASKQTNRPGE